MSSLISIVLVIIGGLIDSIFFIKRMTSLCIIHYVENKTKKERAHAAGFIFLSPDYRLLAPATGHDILSDVLDLFAFIGGGKLGELSGVKVDLENVVVAGSSAGGFCAFLAGAHVVPKPRCVVSMYSMGGDVLVRFFCDVVVLDGRLID